MTSRSVQNFGVNDNFNKEEGIIGDDSVDDEDATWDENTYLTDKNDVEIEDESEDETDDETEDEDESEEDNSDDETEDDSEDATEDETENEEDEDESADEYSDIDEIPPLYRNDVAISQPTSSEPFVEIVEDFLVEGRNSKKSKRKEITLSTISLGSDILEDVNDARFIPDNSQPEKVPPRKKTLEIFPLDVVEDPYRYLWEVNGDNLSFEDFKEKCKMHSHLEIKQKCMRAWLKKVLIAENFELLKNHKRNFDERMALDMVDELYNLVFCKLWYNCTYSAKIEERVLQPIVSMII